MPFQKVNHKVSSKAIMLPAANVNFTKVDSQITHICKSGALRDLCLSSDEEVTTAKDYLTSWRESQQDMTWSLSPVLYHELKKNRRENHKHVLEAAESSDISDFLYIDSAEQHHAIVDRHGNILGYRYPIPEQFLKSLPASTSALPCISTKAGVRGQYPTRHYAVWKEYTNQPTLSHEYTNDLPASQNWCEENSALFFHLSHTLRMINPDTYARYAGTRKYLSPKGLKPLCGIWFGVAINQGIIGTTKSHIDWGDYGYNCVIPWGEYHGGELVLHQLKTVVELKPGDAFYFMGSLITHNICNVNGVRNSIDLFCHKTVLTWKDKRDEQRRGKKVGTIP